MNTKFFKKTIQLVGISVGIFIGAWLPFDSSSAATAPEQTTFLLEQSSENSPFLPSSDSTLQQLYTHSSALELANMVRTKQVNSAELVAVALQQVKQENPQLNAVITLRETAALKEANELEDHGQPFLGVPLLLKGLGQTLKGESNTNGLIFSKDQLAGGTSSFVKGLQEAGFILIGQTNFPELGYKNITDSPLYGPTHNPWNLAYQAGGSSGGAGASVAAGMVPIASGSDAGGSIRIPASWTGTIGLKPSRGVLIGNSAAERGQAVHFALTKTMQDTETLFHALKIPERLQTDPTPLKNLKIGYSTKSPVGTPVSSEAIQAVENAVTFLRTQGFEVEEVDNPIDGVALMKNYYTIASSSASIANFLANQKLKRNLVIEDVDLLTWALYQTGTTITKEQVNAAWEENGRMAAQMGEFHQTYPLFLTPTTAWPAPKVGDSLLTAEHVEKMTHITDLSAEERQQLIYDQWLPALTLSPFTQQMNLTGEAAISLPTHLTAEGLPLGIQFNAAKGQDERLIQMGKLFEEEGQFKQTVSPDNSKEDHEESQTTTPPPAIESPVEPPVEEVPAATLAPIAPLEALSAGSNPESTERVSIKTKDTPLATETRLPKTHEKEFLFDPILFGLLFIFSSLYCLKKEPELN